MNRDFLTEAFRSMNIINEEAFDVDMKGAEEAEDFLDKDEYELLTVIDDEAKDEEEIKTDYTGKVIIECNTCHSKLFKDKEDIKIEDDIVNKDEECPYCNSLDGYEVIGQIAPYEDKEEVKETEVIEEDVSVGKDLDKYQKWVDYDMKRYGKISDKTNKDIKEAGLQIVKDKYGDYQVIAGKYDEELKESKHVGKKLKESGDFYNYPKYSKTLYLPSIRQGKVKLTIGTFNDSRYDDDNMFEISATVDVESRRDDFTLDSEKLYKKLNISDGHEKLSGYDDRYDNIEDTVDEIYEYFISLNQDDIDDTLIELADDVDVNRVNQMFGPIDEKLNGTKKPSKKFIKEQLKRNKKSLRERLEEISVRTDDNKIEVIEDEEGKVTVTSEPACKEPCEVIEEVPEEVKDEIIDNQKEDSEEVDVDIDEIDTDTFGDLTERYLKKTYGNVKCFECKSSKKNNNKIVVEGFITFNSGNKKATQFIFEGHSMDKKGKMKLIGENKQLSNGKKSFVIRGHQDNSKIVCESLNYRYNQNNKMIRGSIK